MTMPLRTITPKHQDLRQITIRMPNDLTLAALGANGVQAIREPVRGQWLDIDQLLVQFWGSRSIRPKIVCELEQHTRDCIVFLLPEATKRGTIDLVGRDLA